MFSLSVVIISRNEEAHIAGCLRSLLAAAEEIGGAEIVVADSASTDRTVEIALSLGVRVISLRPEWGLSAAAGRYVGFHHTRGDLVMFVDGDTVIERGWLRDAVAYFQQAEVAGVSGYLEDMDEGGHKLPYVGKRSAEVSAVAWLRGIGLYRRAALERVGCFNPYLITEEEADLGLRLRRQGWKLLQVPHPMGCHLRGARVHQGILRAWRLGRLTGTGRALRYAWSRGYGPRFGFERFRATLCFLVACLLVGLELSFCLTGQLCAGKLIFLPLLAGLIAIAVKKRNPFGPLTYAAQHSLILCGLMIGFLTTRVRPPQSYPLAVIEEIPPPLPRSNPTLSPLRGH
jgi:glycosyltransferase involved in cell wall biosynthesis